MVLLKLILPLAILLGLGSAQVAPAAVVVDGAAAAVEPFDENPGYAYAFEVNDDEEQVYQAHSQTMEDKVVTGEYSWVDPLGTRHVTVYRADETGFHIVEQREEVGAVVMRPRPAISKAAPVPVAQNFAPAVVTVRQQPAQPAVIQVQPARPVAVAQPAFQPLTFPRVVQPAQRVVPVARTGAAKPQRRRKVIRRVVKRPKKVQKEEQPKVEVKSEKVVVEQQPANTVRLQPANPGLIPFNFGQHPLLRFPQQSQPVQFVQTTAQAPQLLPGFTRVVPQQVVHVQ